MKHCTFINFNCFTMKVNSDVQSKDIRMLKVIPMTDQVNGGVFLARFVGIEGNKVLYLEDKQPLERLVKSARLEDCPLYRKFGKVWFENFIEIACKDVRYYRQQGFKLINNH